jgi:hypothetical protein
VTKHYNDITTIADRALGYVVTATGAVPVAAPAAATDGVDCRHLSAVIARVSADQTTGLNCRLTIVPWIYGRTRTAAAGTAALGWRALPPVVLDCLATAPLGQVFEVRCDAGDRLAFQVTASNVGLAWAHVEAFIGTHHGETQPVVAFGMAEAIVAAGERMRAPAFVYVAAVVNGIDGPYDYYIDRKAGHHATGLQFILNGGSGNVTCTVQATMQDDGTAPAACQYQDVTLPLTGLAAVVASGTYFNEDLLAVARYVRVHVVAATGGANDADWDIQYRSA